MPTQARGRRVSAAVRAAPGARSRRAGQHRRDGRSRGLHRSALPRAPQAAAGARPHPAARGGVRERSSGATSGGLLRTYRTDDAETIVVALGSVNGTVQEAVDAMRARGVADRLGEHLLVPAVSARGACATRCRTRSASSCSRSALPSAWAASCPTACARRCRASCSRATRSSRASAAARSRAPRCGGCSSEPDATSSRQVTFLDLNADVVQRELERERQARPHRPDRRGDAAAARHRRVEDRLMERTPRAVKFYQTGTFTVGNRLLDARRSARCRPTCARTQLAQLRPPRLPGLRRGARRALRDRRCDARDRQPAHRGQRDRLPRGLLDAVSGDLLADRRGSTRCSATPPRSPPASPRRCACRAATRCA